MTKIKTVVFDWDGTIVDSLELKRDAWFLVFPRHGKAYFAMQKFLPELATSTRSQILGKVFAALYEQGEPRSDSERDIFIAKYSSIYRDEVEKGILRKGFLPGAKEALENLHGRLPLYVNSATPLEPLLSVVEKMGATRYFKKIYGRSLAQENHTQYDLKVENLRDIAEKENLDPKEILMVGDAEADEKSAEIFGCEFVHANDLASLSNSVAK